MMNFNLNLTYVTTLFFTIQLLWVAVSLLVVMGAYFGYKKPAIEFPGKQVNSIHYY